MIVLLDSGPLGTLTNPKGSACDSGMPNVGVLFVVERLQGYFT